MCYIFFLNFKQRFTFFEPGKQTIEQEKLARAKVVFDAKLGWKKQFDTPFGERPRAREYNRPLIATFGDSYTYGDQVTHNQSFQL